MLIYVLHSDSDEVLVGHPSGYTNQRGKKKQPKAYTSLTNARIARTNINGRGQIVPYVALNDPALIEHIADFIPDEPMTKAQAIAYVAEVLKEFEKEMTNQ